MEIKFKIGRKFPNPQINIKANQLKLGFLLIRSISRIWWRGKRFLGVKKAMTILLRRFKSALIWIKKRKSPDGNRGSEKFPCDAPTSKDTAINYNGSDYMSDYSSDSLYIKLKSLEVHVPRTDKKWSWPASLIAVSISLYLTGAAIEMGTNGYVKIVNALKVDTVNENPATTLNE
ncbi:hypothetical protein EYS14_03425 [Alteromonadaceae bacterium M269]|nr:hypothetical protein EYS14_03425 [Alteromonadaceae bacterium M269]